MLAICASVLVALLLVPAALAGGSKSSSYSGYGGEGANVQHPVQNAPTATTEQTLPFTGIDLLYVALGGVGVIGAGFAIRRVSRQ